MANTKRPIESENNEVLPLCGVVVPKGTLPFIQINLEITDSMINDMIDFNNKARG